MSGQDAYINGNAQHLHQRALQCHAQGRYLEGAQLWAQAASMEPDNLDYALNCGEMHRLSGQADQAIAWGERALQIDAQSYLAHSNLGIACYDAQDFDKAVEHHQQALAIHDACAPSLNNLGSIMLARDDNDMALEYYQRAHVAAPQDIQIMNNLSVALRYTDQARVSFEILKKIVSAQPQYAEGWSNLGFTALALNDENLAIKSFDKALVLRPDYLQPLVGLARAYEKIHDLDRAENYIRRAIKLAPEIAKNYSILGSILSHKTHDEEALSMYQKALSIDPHCHFARMGMATYNLGRGNIAQAEEYLWSVVNSREDNYVALYIISHLRKVKKNDPIARKLFEIEERVQNFSPERQIYIYFTLGKIYDDLGEYKKAFENYMQGSALKRQKLSYDSEAQDKIFKKMQAICTPAFIETNKTHAVCDDVPVFIVGMPRSGTTLVEQIIASHKDVYGAGELDKLLELVNFWDESYLHNIQHNLESVAPKYIESLPSGYKRVTDKMPSNFFHVGLIHTIFPNAKIVHVTRNPMDTCVSCFTQLFETAQAFTYDLQELGHYYRLYQDLMHYWREILPKGAFYEISYEDLIADSENQARSLLKYCDLPWDPACLDFYQSNRTVRTASVTQVRQPIYKTSQERWRKYESFLQPLKDALGYS